MKQGVRLDERQKRGKLPAGYGGKKDEEHAQKRREENQRREKTKPLGQGIIGMSRKRSTAGGRKQALKGTIFFAEGRKAAADKGGFLSKAGR